MTTQHPTSSGLILTWHEPGIHGYRDYFPPGWLDRPGPQKRVHEVIGPRGSLGLATYALRISGRDAELAYHRFAAANRRAGMDLGWMVVRFTDTTHIQVSQVRWRDPDGREARVKAARRGKS
jgi:hypothetical protein